MNGSLVEVFWVVTPCSVMVGYKRFGGPCCVHLQGESFTAVMFEVEIFCLVTSCSGLC